MKVFTFILFLLFQAMVSESFGQNQVRTMQTSNKAVEVKQINNTPVIYIPKTEARPGTQQLTSSPSKNPRCIKRVGTAPNSESKKKELKEPVGSNDNQ
ncbi:MAG: hypothetical protein BWX95_00185 [Bacteroidetes bacterium ADurb.Bin141]|nr:MAG: hypothetical protein UZ10_BCD003001089 [Bacteroidetes bacterium OLB10]MBV6454037.1 hypothetical protein [Bacteroidia bacterium]MCE7954378.1 hypothetical protein [Bacteroidetes bacterium CHB6]OQB65901.1 MAG: hypothetical protein BWX95_00185 [Bacteroidetes bacterium ADurb.Bin141]